MGKPSHLDRLHFDEFVKSLLPPFPAIAGLFVAAERRLIIECRAVEEALPGAQLPAQLQWTLPAERKAQVQVARWQALPAVQAGHLDAIALHGLEENIEQVEALLPEQHEASIEAIVTGYTEAMVAHHEATKFPPVRGLPHTPDPMRVNPANPISDMEDDLPWLEKTEGKP